MIIRFLDNIQTLQEHGCQIIKIKYYLFSTLTAIKIIFTTSKKLIMFGICLKIKIHSAMANFMSY